MPSSKKLSLSFVLKPARVSCSLRTSPLMKARAWRSVTAKVWIG